MPTKQLNVALEKKDLSALLKRLDARLEDARDILAELRRRIEGKDFGAIR